MIRTVKVASTWIISVKVFQQANTKAVSVGQGLTIITNYGIHVEEQRKQFIKNISYYVNIVN